MSWKYIVVGVCLFFIGGILGTLITSGSFGESKKNFWFTANTSQSVIDTTSPNYQAGFDAAKKLVEESSLGKFIRTEEDIRSVVGVVTAIDGNRVTIHSRPIGNPLDGPVISDRVVVVDTNTKVFELSKKDSVTMDAEIAKAKEESQSNKPTFLEEYTKTASDVSNIVVGDSILVMAGENVKALLEFTAQEIRIEPRASLK